jgi:hypothetical protein
VSRWLTIIWSFRHLLIRDLPAQSLQLTGAPIPLRQALLPTHCNHIRQQGVKSAFSSAEIANFRLSRIATTTAGNLGGNLANVVPRTFGKR